MDKNFVADNICFDIYKGKRIIQEMEKLLQNFDRIVLILHEVYIMSAFSAAFRRYVQTKDGSRRIMVLSVDAENIMTKGIEMRNITKEDEVFLLKLYKMYSFSDKFIVMERNKHYGSIFNYVDKGKLTWEEAIAALL